MVIIGLRLVGCDTVWSVICCKLSEMDSEENKRGIFKIVLDLLIYNAASFSVVWSFFKSRSRVD